MLKVAFFQKKVIFLQQFTQKHVKTPYFFNTNIKFLQWNFTQLKELNIKLY